MNGATGRKVSNGDPMTRIYAEVGRRKVDAQRLAWSLADQPGSEMDRLRAIRQVLGTTLRSSDAMESTLSLPPTLATAGVGADIPDSITALDDLLRLEDTAFIRACYQFLLRREPDEGGYYHHLVALRLGASKITIAGSIRFSVEGKEVATSVPGLSIRYFVDRGYRVPIIGRALRSISVLWHLPQLESGQRALIARLDADRREYLERLTLQTNRFELALGDLQGNCELALRDLQGKFAGLVDPLSSLLAELAVTIERIDHLENVVDSKLSTTIYQSDSAVQSTRMENLERQSNTLQTEHRRELQFLQEAQHELRQANERLATDLMELSTSEPIAGLGEKVKALAARVAELDIQLNNGLTNFTTRLDAQGELANELGQLSEQLDSLHASHDELRTGQGDLRASHDELRTGQSDLRASHDELRTGQSDLRASHDELRTGQGDLRASQDELRTELTQVPSLSALASLQSAVDLISKQTDGHAQSLVNLQAYFEDLKRSQSSAQMVEQRLDELISKDMESLRAHVADKLDQADALNIERSLAEAITKETEALWGELDGKADRAAIIQHLETTFSLLQKSVTDVRKEQRTIARQLIGLPGRDTSPLLIEGTKDAEHHLGLLERKSHPGTGISDSCYTMLEDVFRGTRQDIKQRVTAYLPTLEEAGIGALGGPIVDLGCGRGEWLELLKDHEYTAYGIDLSKDFVERCQQLGLDVRPAEALEHLRSLEDQSVAAVTGFHIVEHLPFDVLTSLLEEAQRVLVPGGVCIFETPNPENIVVGAFTFHYDPTHIKPIPPRLLEFLANSKGFDNVEIMRLHPRLEYQRDLEPISPLLAELLGGEQDYSIIAHKS